MTFAVTCKYYKMTRQSHNPGGGIEIRGSKIGHRRLTTTQKWQKRQVFRYSMIYETLYQEGKDADKPGTRRKA